MKTYTVSEIIQMRRAAEIICRHCAIPITSEGVEAQLRTYMDNDADPHELEDVAAGMAYPA